MRSRGFRNGEKRGGELNAITGLFHALGIAVGSRRAETRGLRRISGPVVAAAMALGTVGCASVDGSAGRNDWRDDDEIVSENDPLEIVNRHIFAANLAVDTFLLRPAAVAYREIVPDFGKMVVRNFLNHLRTPLILINDVAQGEMDRAETSIGRFLVNTVLGLGGLFDPATGLGLAYHNEDVGQTLAVYGVEEGPYLVLPLLGPSNLRDAVGTAVGWAADPVRIGAEAADAGDALYVRGALEGIDTRYRVMPAYDDLRRNSLDFYAFTRSAYRQNRLNEIRNGGSRGPMAAIESDAPQGEAVQPSAQAGSGDDEDRPHVPATPLAAISPAAAEAAEVHVVQLAAVPEGAADAPADDDAFMPTAAAERGDLEAEALRAHEAALRSYEEALRSAASQP